MYPKIIVFDKSGKLHGELANDAPGAPAFWNDLGRANLEKDIYIYEFECAADTEIAQHLIGRNKIAIPDMDGAFVLMNIASVEETQNEAGHFLRVECEKGGLELLDHTVRPAIAKDGTPWYWGAVEEEEAGIPVSLRDAAEYVLGPTDWEVGIVEISDDLTRPGEFREYMTAIAAIRQLRFDYGTEVRYRIEMDGNRIARRFVDFFEMRGVDSGLVFEYAHNTRELRRTEDVRDLATSLVGIGAEIEGERVTIKPVVWDKNLDDPTDKPADQDWIADFKAVGKWGYIERIHENTEMETSEALINDCWNKLMGNYPYENPVSEPTFTYEISVALLERIAGYEHEKARLGDLVRVRNVDLYPPIIATARIKELEWSQTDKDKAMAIIGDLKMLSTDRLVYLQEQLEKLRDAAPPYTWIVFAEDAQGAGISTEPAPEHEYIGFAYNKMVRTPDISDPDIYRWVKFVGDAGKFYGMEIEADATQINYDWTGQNPTPQNITVSFKFLVDGQEVAMEELDQIEWFIPGHPAAFNSGHITHAEGWHIDNTDPGEGDDELVVQSIDNYDSNKINNQVQVRVHYQGGVYSQNIGIVAQVGYVPALRLELTGGSNILYDWAGENPSPEDFDATPFRIELYSGDQKIVYWDSVAGEYVGLDYYVDKITWITPGDLIGNTHVTGAAPPGIAYPDPDDEDAQFSPTVIAEYDPSKNYNVVVAEVEVRGQSASARVDVKVEKAEMPEYELSIFGGAGIEYDPWGENPEPEDFDNDPFRFELHIEGDPIVTWDGDTVIVHEEPVDKISWSIFMPTASHLEGTKTVNNPVEGVQANWEFKPTILSEYDNKRLFNVVFCSVIYRGKQFSAILQVPVKQMAHPGFIYKANPESITVPADNDGVVAPEILAEAFSTIELYWGRTENPLELETTSQGIDPTEEDKYVLYAVNTSLDFDINKEGNFARFVPTTFAPEYTRRGVEIHIKAYRGGKVHDVGYVWLNYSKAIGAAGYVLSIVQGTQTIVYDGDGANPTPLTEHFDKFKFELRKDGELIGYDKIDAVWWTTPVSNSMLSGSLSLEAEHAPHTDATDSGGVMLFGPADLSWDATFDSAKTNNRVSLAIMYDGKLLHTSAPVSITRVGSVGAMGMSGSPAPSLVYIGEIQMFNPAQHPVTMRYTSTERYVVKLVIYDPVAEVTYLVGYLMLKEQHEPGSPVIMDVNDPFTEPEDSDWYLDVTGDPEQYGDPPWEPGEVQFDSFNNLEHFFPALGIPGKSFALNITGGVRTVAYDKDGESPQPSNLGTFELELYVDGESVNPADLDRIEWETDGLVTGERIIEDPSSAPDFHFAPSIAGNFVASGSNVVVVTVDYNGAKLRQFANISCTKEGIDGPQGDPGDDGHFIEYRFRKNTSATTPPALSDSSREPANWALTPPSLDPGEYLWMTKAEIDGDDVLVGTWSAPVRISGEKGEDGAAGEHGAPGPGVPFRGFTDKQEYPLTVYNTAYRRDIVYLTEGDAEGITPDEGYFLFDGEEDETFANHAELLNSLHAGDWEPFGAEFSSVATDILLTKDATITRTLIMGTEEEDGVIRSYGKDSFEDEEPGFWLGMDDGTAKFIIGDEDNYIKWDGENLEQVGGAHKLQDSGITDEGDEPDSIRMWAGAEYENRTEAPFRVTQAGHITAKDIVLGTTENMDFYVDADAGDDDNPGTEGEPLETIQAAIDKLPKQINHKVEIHIAAGEYSDPVNISDFIGWGQIRFVGEKDTGEDNPYLTHLSGGFVAERCNPLISLWKLYSSGTPILLGGSFEFINCRDIRINEVAIISGTSQGFLFTRCEWVSLFDWFCYLDPGAFAVNAKQANVNIESWIPTLLTLGIRGNIYSSYNGRIYLPDNFVINGDIFGHMIMMEPVKFSFTAGALPVPDGWKRGALHLVPGGTGVADQIHICRKNDQDEYEWVQIT